MIETVNAREIVLDMLLETIEDGKYSHTVLKSVLKKHQQLNKLERAFITRMFVGTIKTYLTLDYVINSFSTLPIQKMKPLIRNLLRMSAYQLLYMNQIPASAACNEAVKLAKKRGFAKLSGFVNGILRNIARNLGDIKHPDKQKEPEYYLEIAYSVPGWLVKRLLLQYDYDTVEKLLLASNKEKEITIRCNRRKLTPQELLERLNQEGVSIKSSEYLSYAFIISDFDYLEGLKTFQDGCFTVQDLSSMLVCEVAGISENDYVVDVCAAPGGKALHAAEKAKFVSARDISEYKISLIDENIRRMGFDNVITKVWDASTPDQELLGRADIVIADLPCSGLGVMGKKPDIKYKLTQNQHKELVELQRKILSVVQGYVKSGGVLIFSTCTVDKEENGENRNWFLDNFEYEAENLEKYLPEQFINEDSKQGFLQLLQGTHHSDGFFIAKFRRK